MRRILLAGTAIKRVQWLAGRTAMTVVRNADRIGTSEPRMTALWWTAA